MKKKKVKYPNLKKKDVVYLEHPESYGKIDHELFFGKRK